MSTTTAKLILEHADDNGQITWREASLIAVSHGLWSEFAAQYGCLLASGCGVDVGEFLVWLGY
jgi:hypothetical protein